MKENYEMSLYAVIDTNVIVSALLTKNHNSATVQVIEAVFLGKIIPVFHDDIINEYDEVLHRSKFHLKEETIQKVLLSIRQFGVEFYPKSTGEIFIDIDDAIFYEVAVAGEDKNTYLITGNKKHYPVRNFVVSPAEMINIIKINNLR